MKSKTKILNSIEGYNLTADYYQKKEKYWDSFEKGEVIPLLGDIKGKTVLDVGAGTGRLALKLAQVGATVMALDVSEKMLNKLQVKGYKLQTMVGDAENLPFDDECFDIVIATFLIVHLKDLDRFFSEVYRVLKPAPRLGSPRHELGTNAGQGGIFLVTNINQRKPPEVKTAKGTVVIESFYHRPEFVVKELENLAFTIEKNKFIKEDSVWINQIIVCKK